MNSNFQVQIPQATGYAQIYLEVFQSPLRIFLSSFLAVRTQSIYTYFRGWHMQILLGVYETEVIDSE